MNGTPGVYPDPEKLIQSLHRQSVSFMISVWSNPQGKAGADLKSHRDVISGTDWVDALNPAARELRWKYLNDAFFKIGADAWWQDATEPGDDGNSMANHRVFFGSGDLYRNAYPLFANQTVYEGQRRTSTDKRVVILTRSAYPATALSDGAVVRRHQRQLGNIPPPDSRRIECMPCRPALLDHRLRRFLPPAQPIPVGRLCKYPHPLVPGPARSAPCNGFTATRARRSSGKFQRPDRILLSSTGFATACCRTFTRLPGG